jgi:hypothetical protein
MVWKHQITSPRPTEHVSAVVRSFGRAKSTNKSETDKFESREIQRLGACRCESAEVGRNNLTGKGTNRGDAEALELREENDKDPKTRREEVTSESEER